MLENLTITEIIAIMAIISPVLTAIVNNMFNYKFKKLDYKFMRYNDHIKTKEDIILNYLKFTGKLIIAKYKDYIPEYAEYYSQVIYCVPTNISQMIIEIDHLISIQQYTEAKNKFNALIPLLKNQATR